jgi:hypothetical protein
MSLSPPDGMKSLSPRRPQARIVYLWLRFMPVIPASLKAEIRRITL